MHNPTFHIKVNSQNELCVSGRIDLANVAAASLLGIAVIETINPVRIDLSGIKYADSSSLAMLVAWIRNAKVQHKDVTVINMPQFMLDLGRVCGLDAILPIDKTLKFHS
jgi:anti-anti-sigma factor